MNIALISDLHLGSDDPTDSFGHDDGEFLRFLSFLEANFEKIVLLGDIWETLTSRFPWDPNRAFAAAQARHPEIARRLRSPKYQYIHGNHDLIARDIQGAPESWAIQTNGRRILFTHGHAYDRMLVSLRHLAELGVCVGGWLRRMGLHGLYRWLECIEHRATASPDPAGCRFQAWAVDAARRAQADIIVTGHTHIPLAIHHGHHLYLNSGSCSQGRFTFLGIQPRSDVYAVHHAW